MATWWVKVGGSDAASGTNLATAWEHVDAIGNLVQAAGTTGDTVNIVNNGTHVLRAQASDFMNSFAGTNFTDSWGFRMRGTDASGDPAMTEIQVPNTNGTYELIRPQVTSNFFLIEGLRFTEAASADANANVHLQLFEIGSSPGSDVYKFSRCSFEFGNTQWPSGNRWCCFMDATRATNIVVDSCYLRNIKDFAVGRGGSAIASYNGLQFTRNVCIKQWPGTGQILTESQLTAGFVFNATHNTMVNLYANAETRITGQMQLTHADATGDAGTCTCKDNLYVACVTGDGSNITVKQAMGPVAGYLNAHTFVFNTSDVDYNAWVGQTAAISTTVIPYRNPFSDGDTTPKTNDTSVLVTDADSVLNDHTAAYSWVSGSYTIDLDHDVRPALASLLSAASDGGYVGALEGANQPPVAGPVTYAVTAGNVLTVSAANGVLSNTSDPNLDTLTASIVTASTNTSAFVFNTTTGAFVYTPKNTFSGTDTFTFKAYDGITWSNVSTATINVDEYPIITPGVTTPSITGVIDTAPFFKPDLRVATEIRYKSKKNRVGFKDLANYTKNKLWEESTHRIITLATNTTKQVTLGGVATAEYLQVESDTLIKVSINDANRYWSVDGVVAVALGSASTIYLQNESTTNEAQVILIVVD